MILTLKWRLSWSSVNLRLLGPNLLKFCDRKPNRIMYQTACCRGFVLCWKGNAYLWTFINPSNKCSKCLHTHVSLNRISYLQTNVIGTCTNVVLAIYSTYRMGDCTTIGNYVLWLGSLYGISTSEWKVVGVFSKMFGHLTQKCLSVAHSPYDLSDIVW